MTEWHSTDRSPSRSSRADTPLASIPSADGTDRGSSGR
jgi:hypothetical protein